MSLLKNEYLLFDIHDSNRAKYLMTNWLSTDELSTEELSVGLIVKFLYEAFESHYKTY